jgi:YVTN family beta-propeller protein
VKKHLIATVGATVSLAMLVATGTGYSSWSAQVPTTGAISSVAKIPPPTNAEITQSNGSDVITWKAPTGTVYGGQPIAQSFEIQGSSTGKSGSWSTIATVPGTTRSYAVSASSEASYYRVVTVNNGWLSSYDGGGTAPIEAPSSPTNPKVVATFNTVSEPFDIVSSGTSIYVVGYSGQDMSVINASTGAINNFNNLSTHGYLENGEAVYADGLIWEASGALDHVVEVDPFTDRIIGGVKVGQKTSGITSDGGYVWATSSVSNSVYRINPVTNTATTYTVPGPGSGYGALDGGIVDENGYVWVANDDNNSVTELNTSTGAVVKTIALGSTPTDITYGNGDIWVANAGSNSVTQIDASTGAVVKTITLDSGPDFITYGNGSVWVSNSGSDTVSEISGTTGDVVATIPVGSEPLNLIDNNGYIWVVNFGNNGTVTEIKIGS